MKVFIDSYNKLRGLFDPAVEGDPRYAINRLRKYKDIKRTQSTFKYKIYVRN
jgi:hypothetical protein